MTPYVKFIFINNQSGNIANEQYLCESRHDKLW